MSRRRTLSPRRFANNRTIIPAQPLVICRLHITSIRNDININNGKGYRQIGLGFDYQDFHSTASKTEQATDLATDGPTIYELYFGLNFRQYGAFFIKNNNRNILDTPLFNLKASPKLIIDPAVNSSGELTNRRSYFDFYSNSQYSDNRGIYPDYISGERDRFNQSIDPYYRFGVSIKFAGNPNIDDFGNHSGNETLKLQVRDDNVTDKASFPSFWLSGANVRIIYGNNASNTTAPVTVY